MSGKSSGWIVKCSSRDYTSERALPGSSAKTGGNVCENLSRLPAIVWIRWSFGGSPPQWSSSNGLKSVKITFVLPMYLNSPSGGFKVVYEYANRLQERGHKVSVVHPRNIERRSGASEIVKSLAWPIK